MKFAAPKNSWAYTVPLGGLAAAYIFLMFLPGWKTVDQLRAEFKSKKDYIAQGVAIATRMANTRTDFQKTQAYIADCTPTIPTTAELPSVFERITELAKSSGVSTILFDPQPVDRHAKLSRVPVAMNVAGQSSQIQAFLYTLESLPLRIWIDSVRIHKDGQPGHSVGCEINLAIFTVNSEDSDYAKRVE
jgi:type IV pilus assembly protein PilO